MKKLLVLGALALSTSLVLGACGKADTTASSVSKSASTQTQTVAKEDPNKLTYTVNGQEKSVVASTESLNNGFNIKVTKDFTLVHNQDGDYFKGSDSLAGGGISLDVYPSKNPKIDAQGRAQSEAFTDGGVNKKDIDLSKYPSLKGKYDVFTTSETPSIHKYIFTKVKGNKVTVIDFAIPNSKVTNDTEPVITAIAASITNN